MNDLTVKLPISNQHFVLYHVNQNRFINIYDGLTFGRTEGNELFPQDNLVSKTHCKFHLQGMKFYIEDVGSSNKTKINKKIISPHTKNQLMIGDRLEIGNQIFIFQKQGENPIVQSPVGKPSAFDFKSTFNLKRLRISTLLIIGIPSLPALYALYNLLENECEWGPAPLSSQIIAQRYFLYSLLATLSVGLLNHVVGGMFKAWSWQSISLCLVGIPMVYFMNLLIYFPVVFYTEEFSTNRMACICMFPKKSSSQWENCSAWRNHENPESKFGTYTLNPPIDFNRLPVKVQNRINHSLENFSGQLASEKKNIEMHYQSALTYFNRGQMKEAELETSKIFQISVTGYKNTVQLRSKIAEANKQRLATSGVPAQPPWSSEVLERTIFRYSTHANEIRDPDPSLRYHWNGHEIRDGVNYYEENLNNCKAICDRLAMCGGISLSLDGRYCLISADTVNRITSEKRPTSFYKSYLKN